MTDERRGIGASDYVTEARWMGEGTIMELVRQVWGLEWSVGYFQPAFAALEAAQIPIARNSFLGRATFNVPEADRYPQDDMIVMRGDGGEVRSIDDAPVLMAGETLPMIPTPAAQAEQEPEPEPAPKIQYLDLPTSWPRPATPCDLVPRWAGEFCSYDDWCNFAGHRLSGVRNQTTGTSVGAICVDAHGRRCVTGGDFMRARDEGAYPIRYFWECEPANPGQAASAKE